MFPTFKDIAQLADNDIYKANTLPRELIKTSTSQVKPEAAMFLSLSEDMPNSIDHNTDPIFLVEDNEDSEFEVIPNFP